MLYILARMNYYVLQDSEVVIVANTQLLKGTLEGCVLLVIPEKEVYGYELVQKLNQLGFTDLVGGTVYPLLQKLEKRGDLDSHRKPSLEGPDRKYYFVTEQGKTRMSDFIDEWKSMDLVVNKIISKGEQS